MSIEPILSLLQSKGVSIVRCIPVSGGDINAAYCLTTDSRKLFLKLNSASKFPSMFLLEQEGLEAIRRTGTIAVPNVIMTGSDGDQSFLLMEWVDARSGTAAEMFALGERLAAMHRHTSANFGWTSSSYIGSLVQVNEQQSTWSEFFITQRLQPMVKMAVDAHRLKSTDLKHFERLYNLLHTLFTEEPPALLHGDLWSGNYMIGTDGTPYLIDPAVYYGHREMDIAMSMLFGGFNASFYEGYNAAYPLAAGCQQRVDLWNLYPLLVHVNLFGGSYGQQVRHNLMRYV